jgi:hypothetical protein
MISMDANSQNSRALIPREKFAPLTEALKVDRGPLKVTQQQRAFIQAVCASPEMHNVPPERFFVSCKFALNAAADALKLPLGRERDELTSRLFSVCVEEFFNGDGEADGPPSQDRVELPVRRRVIQSAAKPRDEDCRGAR